MLCIDKIHACKKVGIFLSTDESMCIVIDTESHSRFHVSCVLFISMFKLISNTNGQTQSVQV